MILETNHRYFHIIIVHLLKYLLLSSLLGNVVVRSTARSYFFKLTYHKFFLFDYFYIIGFLYNPICFISVKALFLDGTQFPQESLRGS